MWRRMKRTKPTNGTSKEEVLNEIGTLLEGRLDRTHYERKWNTNNSSGYRKIQIPIINTDNKQIQDKGNEYFWIQF